ISAISAGIASRQHSACSDILPSAPISVIFLLLPPLSFYHPLLFQQTHRNLGYNEDAYYNPLKNLRPSASPHRGICGKINLQSPVSNLQSSTLSKWLTKK